MRIRCESLIASAAALAAIATLALFSLSCWSQAPPTPVPTPTPHTSLSQNRVPQGPATQNPAPQVPPPPGTPQALTLQQAETIAIQNHPRIQSTQALAAAAKQQVREIQSNYFPTVYGSLTGVEAESGSRITAGALNNPIIYDRYANGLTVNQLVTDFGRTHELVKSYRLQAQAQEENVVTSRASVILAVDQAYFAVLKAQSVLQVAQETVKARQVVVDQITALARNQLKSDLDVSFASVDLSQAQLLLIQAQNDLQVAFADLSTALGYSDQRTFTLTDEPLPASAPLDLPQSIAQALQNRPEIVSQRLNLSSANSFANAERDLYFPTISGTGAAGLTPFRQDPLTDRYAAAGFNVNIPIFNGRLFGARESEARYRSQAEQQNLRDLQDTVVRDVRAAWLNANSAFERLAVTRQLLAQATQALDLAQARYNLGLSSIVELTQGQLNLTQAQIANASATYDYQTRLSVLNFTVGNIR
jgi:outer membrane protein